MLRIISIIIFCTFLVLPTTAQSHLGMDIADIKFKMLFKTIEDVQKCALNNNTNCIIELGIHNIYSTAKMQNEEGRENFPEAQKWLEPISAKSSAARFLLGQIKIKEHNLKEAEALITSAATENFRPALDLLMNEYSVFYSNKQDDYINEKTFKWGYKTYIMSHDVDIANNIAAYFMNRPQKDCNSAIEWLTKATTGHSASMLSQRSFAELYETGNCVPQDYVMAYMMYDLSGTGGAEQKHALAKKMTQEQINEGLRRSHQWQDDNHSYRPGYGDWGGSEVHWNVHHD